MAESLKTILMSALTAKATPAETDTMIVGEGNVLKKITFSQLFTYLKDKLGINTLNTKINNKNVTLKTYNGGGYLQTGQTYCIYNDSFLYLHIGFNSIDNSGIQSGTVIMTLPVKVSTVNANIGVIGMGTVQGYKAYIGALSVSSNGYDIVASGFIIAANYIADLMFIRA